MKSPFKREGNHLIISPSEKPKHSKEERIRIDGDYRRGVTQGIQFVLFYLDEETIRENRFQWLIEEALKMRYATTVEYPLFLNELARRYYREYGRMRYDRQKTR